MPFLVSADDVVAFDVNVQNGTHKTGKDTFLHLRVCRRDASGFINNRSYFPLSGVVDLRAGGMWWWFRFRLLGKTAEDMFGPISRGKKFHLGGSDVAGVDTFFE
jgi:hypothetical protein